MATFVSRVGVAYCQIPQPTANGQCVLLLALAFEATLKFDQEKNNMSATPTRSSPSTTHFVNHQLLQLALGLGALYNALVHRVGCHQS